MTTKLPVKIVKLKERKKIGLLAFTLLHLCLSCFFFIIGWGLDKMFGRVICLILFLLSVMQFVFGVIAIIYLVREKFIGFFISSEGLNDISTGHNYGVIMWRDVQKIMVMNDIEVPARKYIVLKLHNPQEYIEREPSHIKRRSMMLKLQYYGSPICFSNRGLDCTFDELEQMVKLYYGNYRELNEENIHLTL